MQIKPINKFIKEVKRLSKKYKNIVNDLEKLEKILIEEPTNGIALGNDIYKIRLANSSIPTGKSGGFRVITYHIKDNKIYLLSIYSKSDKDSITNEEILECLKEIYT